jgi:hypothetical protein
MVKAMYTLRMQSFSEDPDTVAVKAISFGLDGSGIEPR